MATHCSVLAWRIPWTEEPSELRSIGLQRLGTTERLILPQCVLHRLSTHARMDA